MGTASPVGSESKRIEQGIPTESESKCRSCGASIPTTQTKCRFCLINHLGEDSPGTDAESTEETLLGVVHIVVESSTFYAAVAKGAAAATLLTKADRDPAVDDCQLIYDLDAEPAAQLTDKWPSLPEAVRVTSERGEQLLTAARERTGQTESTQLRRDGAHTTFLYDEGGHYTDDEEVALAEYMAFKNEVVSRLECSGPDQRWRLTGSEIEAVTGAETSELITP